MAMEASLREKDGQRTREGARERQNGLGGPLLFLKSGQSPPFSTQLRFVAPFVRVRTSPYSPQLLIPILAASAVSWLLETIASYCLAPSPSPSPLSRAKCPSIYRWVSHVSESVSLSVWHAKGLFIIAPAGPFFFAITLLYLSSIAYLTVLTHSLTVTSRVAVFVWPRARTNGRQKCTTVVGDIVSPSLHPRHEKRGLIISSEEARKPY